MKNVTGDARREARVRLAFRLQIKHGLSAADVAEMLGLTEKSYRNRLRRLKLETDNSFSPTETEIALKRLQSELRKLIDGEELPDKSKAEGLMALARAVKTVSELVSETKNQEPNEDIGATVSIGEMRQVLARINRRIEELAQKRVREILGGGFEATANISGGERMADQSA